MCLDKLRESHACPDHGFGYKRFRTTAARNGKLAGYYCAITGDKTEFIPNTWYEANPVQLSLYYAPLQWYTGGFHLYADKQPNWSQYLVEYDGILHVGEQGGETVIVAKRMRIIEECV